MNEKDELAELINECLLICANKQPIKYGDFIADRLIKAGYVKKAQKNELPYRSSLGNPNEYPKEL